MCKRIRDTKDPRRLERIFYHNVYPGEYEETEIQFDEPFEVDITKTAEELRLDQKMEAWRRQADEARREAAELARWNAALRISQGALATEVWESRRCINNLRAENERLRAAAMKRK